MMDWIYVVIIVGAVLLFFLVGYWVYTDYITPEQKRCIKIADNHTMIIYDLHGCKKFDWASQGGWTLQGETNDGDFVFRK